MSKAVSGSCPTISFDYTRPRPILAYQRAVDRLRDAAPVAWNDDHQGYWAVLGFPEVREAYQHPEIFTNDSQDPLDPNPTTRFMPTHKNPPDLNQYRQLLTRWFSPGAIDRAWGLSRESCRSRVEKLTVEGSCDFVADFALRYPTEVFLHLIGLPMEDAALFLPWVETLFTGHHGTDKSLVAEASRSIKSYFVDAMAERRRRPRDAATDLVSALMNATVFGRPLEEDELLDLCFVLVAAGLDTTRSQMSFLFYHLATHADDRWALRADPAKIRSAVEEGMRTYSIIGTDGRKVGRDVTFHGASMREGDMVWLSVAAANRDPRAFEAPDQFQLDRPIRPHLGFAAGPHRCIGSHLARHEMAIANDEWLKQIPEFVLGTDEPIMVRGGMLAPISLPLAW